MKFLIDNNLSYKLTELLKPVGIDASHIKNELSVFSMDHEIWEFAEEYDFVLVTKVSFVTLTGKLQLPVTN